MYLIMFQQLIHINYVSPCGASRSETISAYVNVRARAIPYVAASVKDDWKAHPTK